MAEKKIDARVRYTKMMIRNSFIALLRTKPLAKITVTEICAGAGINRATFYAHYSDPYELLRRIQTEMMDDVLSGLRGPVASDDPDLRAILSGIFEYIRQNADVCELLLSDGGDEGFMAQVVEMLQLRFLTEWEKRGSISREDAEYLYTYAAIGSAGLIKKWLSDGMKKSPAQMAEIVIKLANHGYSAFR